MTSRSARTKRFFLEDLVAPGHNGSFPKEREEVTP